MAEKYGTIPKRFTAAWWGYVWEYYKWRIIIPAAIIAAVIATIIAKAYAPKYDMNLLYAGTDYITKEQSAALCNALGEYIDDTDGNGVSIDFSQLSFVDSLETFETDSAYDNKLLLEFTDSDTMIMLVDSVRAELLTQTDTYEGALMSVSEWAESMPSDELLYSYEDTAYAVKLSESAILEDCGISGEDMYVVVRRDFTGKDKAQLNIAQAVKAANALIGQRQ